MIKSLSLGILALSFITAPLRANPLFKPSPVAVGIAQQLGFPAVPAKSGIAGPFTDNEGLFYADREGRVSYFLPAYISVLFLTLDSKGNPRLDYALTPRASFRFQQGQPIPVDTTQVTAAVGKYPLSGAMVNVLVAALQFYRDQIYQMPTFQLPPEQHSKVSSTLHQTSMNILRNIGNEGCTEHYEGVYYLGCW